jgi:hypothetical protein
MTAPLPNMMKNKNDPFSSTDPSYRWQNTFLVNITNIQRYLLKKLSI